MKLIAGAFEIEKPYFNLDTTNVDRELGLQRATGIELSLSGEVIRDLNITAAMLWGEMKVLGPNLKAEGIGSIALNQARLTASTNASYSFTRRPAYGCKSATVCSWAVTREVLCIRVGQRLRGEDVVDACN